MSSLRWWCTGSSSCLSHGKEGGVGYSCGGDRRSCRETVWTSARTSATIRGPSRSGGTEYWFASGSPYSAGSLSCGTTGGRGSGKAFRCYVTRCSWQRGGVRPQFWCGTNVSRCARGSPDATVTGVGAPSSACVGVGTGSLVAPIRKKIRHGYSAVEGKLAAFHGQSRKTRNPSTRSSHPLDTQASSRSSTASRGTSRGGRRHALTYLRIATGRQGSV